jgi:hypothetical protein
MMGLTCSLEIGDNKYWQKYGKESSSKVTTWQQKKEIGDNINMNAS